MSDKYIIFAGWIGLLAVGITIIVFAVRYLSKEIFQEEEQEINNFPDKPLNRAEGKRLDSLISFLIRFREDIERIDDPNIKLTLEGVLKRFMSETEDIIELDKKEKKKRVEKNVLEQIKLFDNL
jgi:hypothetical protein